jgi:transcriptional regulator with GAF, ATPase, and Fis domain
MQCAAWRTDDDRRVHASGSGQPFDRDVARVLTGGRGDRIDRPRPHTRGCDEHEVAESEIAGVRTQGAIVYKSEAIRSVLTQVQQVAPTNATVLLLGETGVGKQLFAQAIHDASSRRGLPMVSVNCAAIPTTLIESELFGHERGAFTGAVARQIGRFEVANGSTLFLDEIGEVPLEVQVKLLRVLQERVIERLGGHGSKAIDVRIIAATNRDLEQAVRHNTFREDLYYRLNVFPITVPPLRERAEDIPGLVWTFVHELSRTLGKRIAGISARSLAELQQYPWPGNVRELRNVIEREIIQATGPIMTPTMPRGGRVRPGIVSQRLVDVQTEHIRSVLDSCNWRIRGEGGAAERLGLKPTTLETRMARLGIYRSQHTANPPIRTGF